VPPVVSALEPMSRDPRERMILALGESTGHAHAVVGKGALYPAAEPLEPMYLHLPDGGRFHTYWLRVPPHARTAKEAVAWTFGLSEQEYAPMVQT
jgi:hypothetical protein